MNKLRLTKSVLLAAAGLALATPAAKAYDPSYWNYTEGNASIYMGSEGGYWADSTSKSFSVDFSSDILNAPWNSVTEARIKAGIYNVRTYFDFSFDGGEGTYDLSSSINGNGDVGTSGYAEGGNPDSAYGYRRLLPIDSMTMGGSPYGYSWTLSPDFTYSNLTVGIEVTERNYQVARTSTGFYGAEGGVSFQADNNYAKNSIFAKYPAYYGGEGYDLQIGSVIRNGSISLGFGGVQQGMYAKDAGWLDIKGDLRLYSGATLLIRDAEVTSNIYRNDFQAEDGTSDQLVWESGVLSVRQRFYQDMSANEGQTLGFRDGAVNATDFNIIGGGYSQPISYFLEGNESYIGAPVTNFFEGYGDIISASYDYSYFGGEGYFAEVVYPFVGGGAVRSITGNNVQNGNINIGLMPLNYTGSIGLFGEGDALPYARINSDVYLNDSDELVQSVLTINGNINGVNGEASMGGALLILGGEGKIVVNGQIGAGIGALYKDGNGEVVLNAANSYGDPENELASTFVSQGTVRVANSQGLGHGTVFVGQGSILDTFLLVQEPSEEDFYNHLNSMHGGSVVLDAAYNGSNTASLTINNNFVVNGHGTVGFGEGHSDATASIVNFSGNNTINGDIRVGLSQLDYLTFATESTDGGAYLEGSVLVQNGTTLTVNGNLGTYSSYPYLADIYNFSFYEGGVSEAVLDIDTQNKWTVPEEDEDPELISTGKLIVNGSTGDLTSIRKWGDGEATIATADGALSSVYVYDGKLTLTTTSSNFGEVFGSFSKYGDGTLVLTGAEGQAYYSDLNLYGGATDIYGTVQVNGLQDGSNTIDVYSGEGSIATSLNVYGALNYNVGGEGGFIGIHLHSGGEGSSAQLNIKWVDESHFGVVDLGGSELLAEQDASINVAGELKNFSVISLRDNAILTVQKHGVVTGNINTRFFTDDVEPTLIANNSRIYVQAGGSLTGNITLGSTSQFEVRGTKVGEVVTNGIFTGDIDAHDDSIVTLGAYGILNGDVVTTENARFIIEDHSIHNGSYNSSSDSHITIDGDLTGGEGYTGDFYITGGARLDGHGKIGGGVVQTGGVVAPGNSPGILTIVGNYSNSGGVLDIEIAGVGAAGTAYDQLRVGGLILVSNAAPVDYSTLQLGDWIGDHHFASTRGQVFQVIADLSGNARSTGDKFDLVVYNNVDGGAAPTRILFDHSTGRAYGTGLDLNSKQTFRDYGVTANQKEIGRALWMEAISHDKTAFNDENFAADAINAPEGLLTGYKAFILTSNTGAGEEATGLGAAAISVLTAADAGAALDALSPVAYTGIAEQGARVARGFARLGFEKRTLATNQGWDYSVGYSNDSMTSESSRFKDSSDQFNVTASRDLSKNVRLTIGVGHDDGKVSAPGFNADINTIGVSADLGYTPDAKGWRFNLGVAYTSADWDAIHNGVGTSADNQDSYAVAGRLTIDPIKKGSFSFAPYLGLAYSRSKVDGFTEANSTTTAAVSVSDLTRRSVQGEIGANFEYQIRQNLTLGAVLAWEHEFQNSGETTMTAAFADDGVTDTEFTIKSKGYGADQFRAGLSLRYDIGTRSSVSVGYDAILGSEVNSGGHFRANYNFRF